MTSSQLSRINGIGLVIGAIAYVIHLVLRSVITAGVEPSVFAKQALWVQINTLGLVGAVLVLLGLPAMYARLAGPTGLRGLVGVALIAVAWMFFGVFLSLYSVLVLPWLAEKAPALVAASASPAGGVVIAFIVGLVAWLSGAVLLAIPFIRGRAQPRWVGYVLIASALWLVISDLIIAPSGPTTNLTVNLLSNLGPVLLLVAVGHLGFRMWLERAATENAPKCEPT
jgi:hypothetical protein